MLDKYEDYLGLLPLTKVIKDRIKGVINLNSKIIDDEIVEIFISDMKGEDNIITYTSLWLFTDKYSIECKNFLTKEDFDITPYVNNIKYCSVKSIDFAFEDASEKSAIQIYFSFKGTVTGKIIAT